MFLNVVKFLYVKISGSLCLFAQTVLFALNLHRYAKTFCDCCCIVVFLLYVSLIADILSVHRLGKVWCNLSAIIFLSKKWGFRML